MTRVKEKSRPIIHWFRKDLRLADNPALSEAAKSGNPIVALYIHEDGNSDPWAPGGASKWWLHHSLLRLDESLKSRGNRLILRSGNPLEILKDIAIETGAEAVYVTRLTEPHAIKTDAAANEILASMGVKFRVFDGNLLFPPERITTKKGEPFKVFTPFYKACMQEFPLSSPLPVPSKLPRLENRVKSDSLGKWKLVPTNPDWSAGWLQMWTPGEFGAFKRLDSFLDDFAREYSSHRDRPDIEGTSKLSPHLHFGEVSPRMCWDQILDNTNPYAKNGFGSFFRQIIWREFSNHLLYHWPTFPEEPFREEFLNFPWGSDSESLRRWQRGLTGYPIVDAGMRELWATGWMHNRVRMVAASFLVKHLLIPWQKGAEWFWDTLLDADLANNSVSWQWVSGCGVDAAPYFRIFNPILQGKKFDPEGSYVRRWVPELNDLSNEYIHEPWKAEESGGFFTETHYPSPLVEHQIARDRALMLFNQLKFK